MALEPRSNGCDTLRGTVLKSHQNRHNFLTRQVPDSDHEEKVSIGARTRTPTAYAVKIKADTIALGIPMQAEKRSRVTICSHNLLRILSVD